MRNVWTLLLATAVCMTSAGCGLLSSPAGKIPPQELGKADLHYYWPLDMKLAEDETVKGLQLLDENLYCLTSLNRLVALDAATGDMRWSKNVAAPGEKVFRPVHVDNVSLAAKPVGVSEIMEWKAGPPAQQFDAIMINTVEYVLVLDRATGVEYRRIPFQFSANSGGTSDGRYFYAGSTGGRCYAFALNEAVLAWSLEAGGMISAPLEYLNGRVFVAGEDYNLYSAQTGTRGKTVWSQRLDGSVTARMYVDERGCFVPCGDNRLYAFDSMNGTPLWGPFVCQGPLHSGVQASDNSVFIYAENDGFYAIDIETGEQRWSVSGQGRIKVVAVSEGLVYLVNTTTGHLVVADEMLGKVKHTLRIAGVGSVAGNARVDAIYTATADGKVYCIRPRKSERLTSAILRGQEE